MQLPAWATQKLGPLPVWSWGALSLAGGVGYVLYRRRQAATGGATLGADAQAVPATYPYASDGGGGIPGGFGGGPGDQGGGLLSGAGGVIGTTPAATQTQTAATQQQAAAPAPAPAPAATFAGTPAVAIAPSLLGGGYQASRVQLQNPVGSADAAAANPANSYAPSLTDYATEQPGGISVVQAGLPGTQPNQGLTYTIYGTNTGSGNPVPASQRIAGERYDSSGRVIL